MRKKRNISDKYSENQFAFVPYSVAVRKLVITVILSLVAFYLLVLGASAAGTGYESVETSVYFSAAAIVFAIAIIPWATKE